ncbi:response regulator [Marinomonas agarivorans]|nr:response regulator [Marinomonas agarivorans]
MNTSKILLVEDNQELAELVYDYLDKKGFNVTVINDGAEAVDAIRQQQPDLVILDIMLPGMSGLEICRTARVDYNGAILMLTALDEDMDQIVGLEMGADDYIIKPVHPRLLLTRIQNLLRRMGAGSASLPTSTSTDAPNKEPEPSQRSMIHVDKLKISLSKRSVEMNGKRISLTTAEFELLLLLAEHIGEVVERETIVQQLRGFDYDGMDRSIDRRISRLRKKLQAEFTDYEVIKTIHGRGYQLCTSE